MERVEAWIVRGNEIYYEGIVEIDDQSGEGHYFDPDSTTYVTNDFNNFYIKFSRNNVHEIDIVETIDEIDGAHVFFEILG